MKREEIAKMIDPRGWEPYSGTGYERKAWLEGAREDALAKADTILSALKASPPLAKARGEA